MQTCSGRRFGVIAPASMLVVPPTLAAASICLEPPSPVKCDAPLGDTAKANRVASSTAAIKIVGAVQLRRAAMGHCGKRHHQRCQPGRPDAGPVRALSDPHAVFCMLQAKSVQGGNYALDHIPRAFLAVRSVTGQPLRRVTPRVFGWNGLVSSYRDDRVLLFIRPRLNLMGLTHEFAHACGGGG